MLPYPITNFEIKKKYHEREPKFNGVYSKHNLRKKKDTAYVVHLDEYQSVGTHWIALYVNNDNVKFFDSFEVECIFKKSNNS